MKSSTQLLLVTSALLVAGFAVSTAGAADTSADQPTVGHGLKHHNPPPEIMAIYDVDQNGALDADERAVLHEDIASGKIAPPPGGPGRHRLPAEIFAKYDANSDGELDETERAALKADIASGKVKLPPRRGMRQPPPEILAQYDTNKDGQLDDAERAVLHADIESGKLPPPPHGRGRGPAEGTVPSN